MDRRFALCWRWPWPWPAARRSTATRSPRRAEGGAVAMRAGTALVVSLPPTLPPAPAGCCNPASPNLRADRRPRLHADAQAAGPRRARRAPPRSGFARGRRAPAPWSSPGLPRPGSRRRRPGRVRYDVDRRARNFPDAPRQERLRSFRNWPRCCKLLDFPTSATNARPPPPTIPRIAPWPNVPAPAATRSSVVACPRPSSACSSARPRASSRCSRRSRRTDPAPLPPAAEGRPCRGPRRFPVCVSRAAPPSCDAMPFAYYDRLSPARQAIYRKATRSTRWRCPRACRWPAPCAPSPTAWRRIAAPPCSAARRTLVDALVTGFAVPPVAVRVLAVRPSDHEGELHGLYEPNEDDPPARISVWMRTAQRKQVVAFRSFLRTVVHEFLHHLDYEHFELAGDLPHRGLLQARVEPRQRAVRGRRDRRPRRPRGMRVESRPPRGALQPAAPRTGQARGFPFATALVEPRPARGMTRPLRHFTLVARQRGRSPRSDA